MFHIQDAGLGAQKCGERHPSWLKGFRPRRGANGIVREAFRKVWEGRSSGPDVAEQSRNPKHGWFEVRSLPLLGATVGGSEARPAILIFSVADLSGRIGVGPPESVTPLSERRLGLAERRGDWPDIVEVGP